MPRSAPNRPGPPTLALALLVALGYYLGARLGFVLRFPPAVTSVIWPPNAFLTAVLLLSTPRRFWIYLLAALPAHFVVELQAGLDPAIVAALFVTNCFEALVAALLIHRWSDDPTRVDTLRRVGAFVVGAVLVAPLVSTFADAAVVHWLRGEPYDVVWLRRAFSNTLSQLTLVPSLLLVVREGLEWLRGSSRQRRIEALLLAAGLISVGMLVFNGYQSRSSLPPGGPYTALPLLLPLLFLAAVRFGPAGASLSLLASALIAIGAALAGWTPLLALPVEERVLALQVFLIVVGVPLLVLSALIEERRQIADTLRERLRFEKLLSQLSGAFVQTPGHDMHGAFETWLERVGRFLGIERVELWQLSRDDDTLVLVARWSDPPADAAPTALSRSHFPWSAPHWLGREPFVWPEADDLPAEAEAERALMHRTGVRSLLTFPLLAGSQAFGSLALVTTAAARHWSPSLVERCRLLADVFAGALARRRAESGLQKTRQELAHTLRVSTIGELTTSLAHELNQPLAAILANAQAARRMLAAGAPAHPDLAEILDEIIEEDKRAGEVIQRLRELLRKGETERAPLDLNALVRDVVKLLGNDVMIRGVTLREELAAEPLTTRGDRVQLRQVVLNLVINALDALAEVDGERRVVIRTDRVEGGLVRASVADTGPGLRPPDAGDVFRPFYTTKEKGMGMGLSIARSILEAHGGTISAWNNPEGGATFAFTLPLVAPGSPSPAP